MRWGKNAEEGFGGKQRVPPNINQVIIRFDTPPACGGVIHFIVKDHSFVDGNKRIAAVIFTWFLERNGLLYKSDETKRIADNALVALTLMIAMSDPKEKDIITKIIVNLINKDN